MARPMLADPDFVLKAQEGRPEDINTCIACNQACLDFIFSDRTATCLVNPRACRETEFEDAPRQAKRIAVIGSGPAGLAVASTAGARGHHVTLFEEHAELGGQIHLARRVPGVRVVSNTDVYSYPLPGDFNYHSFEAQPDAAYSTIGANRRTVQNIDLPLTQVKLDQLN
jgi:2,4-dienoyl-CoA reductase (NADPH2)